MTDRIRKLGIGARVLPQFFGVGEHHYEVEADALPADAVVVGARFDPGLGPWTGTLWLWIQSEAFSPAGVEPPAIVPTLRRVEGPGMP